jgi:predicted Zn finger-like uncharacterized protein
MADEKYTRCPGCKTVFRVTAQQLAMRAGQVRCGHCKTVFDGNAAMISLAPRPREEMPPDDEAALGPPTVTLRNAQALEPVEPTPKRAPAAVDESVREIAYEERFAWAKPKRKTHRFGVFYATAVPLLLLLLLAQLLVHYRDAVAAHWPATKPLLSQLCDVTGCVIRPLRDAAMISIESSDLQADPAHKGLLVLTANVRNLAPWPLAYPHLELTLTDAKDEVVVRRALAPSEYAGGTADIAAGISPNGEVAIKLFIDASATVQAGYRVFLFYP